MTKAPWGPQGTQLVLFVAKLRHLTKEQADRLEAAWRWFLLGSSTYWPQEMAEEVRTASKLREAELKDLAKAIHWSTMSTWVYEARNAASYASEGLLLRDLISESSYRALTSVWREAIGPIHAGDGEGDPLGGEWARHPDACRAGQCVQVEGAAHGNVLEM